MPLPKLTFFCELESQTVEEFFNNPEVIGDLSALKATVSLSIQDMSDERAQAVKKLNNAGVPVTAWLLLPRDQGYYFNIDNTSLAFDRYRKFRRWSDEKGLRWSTIGLDIEPNLQLMLDLVQRKWRALRRAFPQLVSNAFNRRRYWNARHAYAELIDEIHSDGYLVECYQLPVLEDERRVRSTLLQRLTGVIDIPADREVWMLYSSHWKRRSPGFLWSYASQAQAIGVGSTGGGMEVDTFQWAPLKWEELARDLRLAWHWTNQLYIFSLEGCYREGHLKKLRAMTWDQPIFFPVESAEAVNARRRVLKGFLWFNKNSLLILALMLGGFMLAIIVQRLLRQRKPIIPS